MPPWYTKALELSIDAALARPTSSPRRLFALRLRLFALNVRLFGPPPLAAGTGEGPRSKEGSEKDVGEALALRLCPPVGPCPSSAPPAVPAAGTGSTDAAAAAASFCLLLMRVSLDVFSKMSACLGRWAGGGEGGGWI